MSTINPGDVVRVSTDPPFTNSTGVATDPTTVMLRWKAGRHGEETVWIYGTDAEVVRDSAGTFHADITVTEALPYFYRWEGTGTVQAAEASAFLVVEGYPFLGEGA